MVSGYTIVVRAEERVTTPQHALELTGVRKGLGPKIISDDETDSIKNHVYEIIEQALNLGLDEDDPMENDEIVDHIFRLIDQYVVWVK